MRDPAVLAVFALHMSAAELAAVLDGASIVRPFWPPQQCRGAVVGLHAEGAVVGEALLFGFASNPEGGCLWSFGPVTRYARALPHPLASRRAMASPMPAAPLGTLTISRNWEEYQ